IINEFAGYNGKEPVLIENSNQDSDESSQFDENAFPDAYKRKVVSDDSGDDYDGKILKKMKQSNHRKRTTSLDTTLSNSELKEKNVENVEPIDDNMNKFPILAKNKLKESSSQLNMNVVPSRDSLQLTNQSEDSITYLEVKKYLIRVNTDTSYE
ncbi:4746_t:CDS:2, partial [Dentiscutata erythropus]